MLRIILPAVTGECMCMRLERKLISEHLCGFNAKLTYLFIVSGHTAAGERDAAFDIYNVHAYRKQEAVCQLVA